MDIALLMETIYTTQKKLNLNEKQAGLLSEPALLMLMIIVYGREEADVIISCDSPDFEQSEKEVSDLHQRTKEGIETARRKGKQIGRKQGAAITTKKSIKAKQEILKYSRDFNGTLTDVDCMRMIGIARNTYYKYKAELKATL